MANPLFLLPFLLFRFLVLPAAEPGEAGPDDQRYRDLEKRYVVELLRRNPVVSTYLGGAGRYPELARVDGALRDWSPAKLAEEAVYYRQVRAELAALDGRRLSPRHRIDVQIALHQIAFILRQTDERRIWQRSLDTYVSEPFRGLDWWMQGMTDVGDGRIGTVAEWQTAAARVEAIPRYLATAQANLQAGIDAGNTPDWRMIERDGLQVPEENARYFEKALPAAAARTLGETSAVARALWGHGRAAAKAFRDFREFVERTLAKLPRIDRYALGEKEYDWALRNNLHVDATAASLHEEALPVVEKTRRQLVAQARAVAGARRLKLGWSARQAEASVRSVLDVLAQDHPRSDEAMVDAYRRVCSRLVEYGRASGLFDVPADYRLDVTVTPAALQSSIDGAAYYPAPPFKQTGVGRFYVSPTGGDVEFLKQANHASMADLGAHEGFPGHDWHYKVMATRRDQISPVRWLTPGEVEGSASMWQDSMASEGWALYAEALMAEPAPGARGGAYTPEETIYVLQAQLMRDLRVRIDIGIHTGRMTYDEAVDLYSSTLDFLPGSCKASDLSPEKKASCATAERAIFRYSKWPTQAITYRLGKDRILSLRRKAEKLAPGREGLKRFHLLYMEQGTIPPDTFGPELLRRLAGERGTQNRRAKERP